jgi:hypothetical protein
MPATSKAQQRLMGMAYALKKGEMDPEDASQEVKYLADGMTLKQLKKYASTKHKGLPDKIEESKMKTISKAEWKKAPKDHKTTIKGQKYMMQYDDEMGTILAPVIVEDASPANISGMGAVKFPTGESTGSGDVPAGQGDAEEEYKKKKRKAIPTFEQFVNESMNLDPIAANFLDIIQTANNKIKLKDVTVEATPKGNWQVYWQGKSLMKVDNKFLDDATVMKYNLEHH